MTAPVMAVGTAAWAPVRPAPVDRRSTEAANPDVGAHRDRGADLLAMMVPKTNGDVRRCWPTAAADRNVLARNGAVGCANGRLVLGVAERSAAAEPFMTTT